MVESAPRQPSKSDQPKKKLVVDRESTERHDFMFALIAEEGLKKAQKGEGASGK